MITSSYWYSALGIWSLSGKVNEDLRNWAVLTGNPLDSNAPGRHKNAF